MNGILSFFDGSVQHRIGGALNGSIHREHKWKRRDVHVTGFVLVHYNRELKKTVCDRVRKMYISDDPANKMVTFEQIFFTAVHSTWIALLNHRPLYNDLR